MLLDKLLDKRKLQQLPAPQLLGCKDRLLGCGTRRMSLPDPALRDKQKRAAVAVVLRSSGGGGGTEVLMIKRQTNPKDPWSGHIALPGGRQNANEIDLETAIRETREEVGVNLSGGGFEIVARLDDRAVTVRNRKLVISAFVFRQLRADSPALHLQQSEVAEAWWVDLDRLAAQPATELSFDPRRVVKALERPWLWRIANLVGADEFFFPCNFLDPPRHLVEANEGAPPPPRDYALWGITLHVLSDLVRVSTGMPLPAATAPSFRARSPVATVVLRTLNWCHRTVRERRAVAAAVAATVVAVAASAVGRVFQSRST